MRIKIAIFFLIILVACQKQEKKEHVEIETISIKIDEFIHLLELSPWYEAEFIPLEMTPESKIGNIYRVIIYKDFIFVLDRFNAKKLFVFDKSGKFIRTVGSLGRGAGEYVELVDFDVEDDIIYISSYHVNKMLLFDIDGNHLRDIKFSGYIGYEFVSLGKNGFLVADVEKSNKSAIFFNRRGKEKNTISNQKIDFLRYSNPSCFASYNNIQYMYFGMNDTVYVVKDYQLIPKLVVDFGKKSVPYDKLKSNEEFLDYRSNSEFLDLTAFFEKSKHYFIEVADRNFTYKAIVDKTNGYLQYGNIILYKGFPISKPVGETNDGVILTWGPPIEPIYSNIVNEKYEGFVPEGFNEDELNANPGIVIIREK